MIGAGFNLINGLADYPSADSGPSANYGFVCMKISRFEELDIWKFSLEMTQKIYSLSSGKEFSKDFALRDQIRRSILSVGANIAEGFERNNNNEFIRFFFIAKGSVGETRSHLHVAKRLKYISDQEFTTHSAELEDLAKQIGGFITYLMDRRRAGEFNQKLIR